MEDDLLGTAPERLGNDKGIDYEVHRSKCT